MKYATLMARFIILLMPMSSIISKNVEHFLEKIPRELMERFTYFPHLYYFSYL